MSAASWHGRLSFGAIVRFDGKRTRWRVRGLTPGGRYAVCTCSMFGRIYYTILDAEKNIRGPLNIVGGGMGITTTQGADEGISDILAALRGDPEWGEGWHVSQRNNTPISYEISREGRS